MHGFAPRNWATTRERILERRCTIMLGSWARPGMNPSARPSDC